MAGWAWSSSPGCGDIHLVIIADGAAAGVADDGAGRGLGGGAAILSVTLNPFSATARLEWSVPAGHLGDHPVVLRIFDVAGREVARLLDGPPAAGAHALSWSQAASRPLGVYYARLETPKHVWVERFVLVR